MGRTLPCGPGAEWLTGRRLCLQSVALADPCLINPGMMGIKAVRPGANIAGTELPASGDSCGDILVLRPLTRCPLIGMHTIAMETYPFIAVGAWVVDDVFTQRHRHYSRAWAKAIRGHGRFYSRRGQTNNGERSRLRRSCERPFAAR